MKKDCRSYKKWLEKQESKANNLNDKVSIDELENLHADRTTVCFDP